jgi:UDP-glucose 4-epimerase
MLFVAPASVRAVKRAVVTGGAGFVGSHVADRLLEQGYEVLVVDDLSAGVRANVPADADFAELDIRDRSKLAWAFDAFKPNVVCHLAAQASVTFSVREPEHDLEVNVAGTLNVCECARRAGASVVFASTGGALYGDGVALPSDESTPTRPLSPYGASKLAGEAYLTTWARLYDAPNVVLRLGNVYGPRQQPHGEAGVVAIFSNKLANGEQPTVFGDGRQTRDYVYVGDVARAFVLAAEAGRAGTWNVGTAVETDVLELLALLQRAAGTELEPRFEPLRPGELMRSALDPGAIGQELGWRAEVAVDEGIAETYGTFAPA